MPQCSPVRAVQSVLNFVSEHHQSSWKNVDAADRNGLLLIARSYRQQTYSKVSLFASRCRTGSCEGTASQESSVSFI